MLQPHTLFHASPLRLRGFGPCSVHIRAPDKLTGQLAGVAGVAGVPATSSWKRSTLGHLDSSVAVRMTRPGCVRWTSSVRMLRTQTASCASVCVSCVSVGGQPGQTGSTTPVLNAACLRRSLRLAAEARHRNVRGTEAAAMSLRSLLCPLFLPCSALLALLVA